MSLLVLEPGVRVDPAAVAAFLGPIMPVEDLAATIVDETSGQWTRNGIPMSASEFAILWSAVAPGQAAPSPGGSMTIDSTVVIEGMALAINNAAAPDPCQADANSLDAAATNYNLAVGGSILGAAAIGVLEVPTWGTATAGFVGLSGLVISAKVSYNAACKNFQLCCKNNNWPAGVCRPKGAKRPRVQEQRIVADLAARVAGPALRAARGSRGWPRSGVARCLRGARRGRPSGSRPTGGRQCRDA